VKFELKRKKKFNLLKKKLGRSLNFERAPLILQRELKRKNKEREKERKGRRKLKVKWTWQFGKISK
jgi:hypothetical protein